VTPRFEHFSLWTAAGLTTSASAQLQLAVFCPCPDTVRAINNFSSPSFSGSAFFKAKREFNLTYRFYQSEFQ
jgi:hypothetical protein